MLMRIISMVNQEMVNDGELMMVNQLRGTKTDAYSFLTIMVVNAC